MLFKNGALSKANSLTKHNDLVHLEKKLKEIGYKAPNTYVVTESVFSMDGVCTFKRASLLCQNMGLPHC